MKIGWTYIINSKSIKTVEFIKNRILQNYSNTSNIKSELYHKDKSKTYITFESTYDDFELTNFLTTKLTLISHQWYLSLYDTIIEINGFTDQPKDQHHHWISFMIIDNPSADANLVLIK